MTTHFEHHKTTCPSQIYLKSNFYNFWGGAGRVSLDFMKNLQGEKGYFLNFGISTHTLNSSKALQNEYYATQKLFESGLLCNEM